MSDTPFLIRLAEPGDAAAITGIYNEAVLTTTASFDMQPQSVEARLEWLNAHDDRHPVFVAEIDGQVAGWGSLTKWSERPAYNDTAETSFYVAAAHQGRGIGRALKAKLIDEARRLGFYTLIARMAEESFASMHLNESFGFQYIGTMKEVGLKFGRRLDVHIMQLMLDEAEQPAPPEVSDASQGEDLAAFVIDGADQSFRANKGWADKAIAQLPYEKLRVALDQNTNSIAVIMKHVAGNLLSRWTDFLASDGEKPWRNRDDEFVDTFGDRAEVLDYWERGWGRLFETLDALTLADLSKTVMIRGEPHSVPLAIQRSLSHCGYHVGQIVMIARILAGDDWQTLTIPRGGSAGYNQNVWGKGHYRT